jgi:fermentation-respiration switch protein FrsA (DUF1100 family)
VVAYLAVAGTMVVNQREYLYFPPRDYPVTPGQVRLAWESLTLTATDGVRIRAWWIPAGRFGRPERSRGAGGLATSRLGSGGTGRAGAPILYYLHGNGSNLSSFVEIAQACHAKGVAFFAIDYRGYGESEGSPSEAGLHADALAGYRWLTERHGEARMVLYGQSLGSAVASWLAGVEKVHGLVLEAALPSTVRMARLHYPWLWVPEMLIRDRFRTVDDVARATCPVLVIHGERDEISPIRFGREVFAAAHEPKEFLPVPGAGHNDLRWNEPMIQSRILGMFGGQERPR